MDGSQVELAPLPVNEAGRRRLNEQNFEPIGDYSRAVPPPDGGKDAWLFLLGCFFVEALVWGFPFSYGIFQQYYSENEMFAGEGSIAVIGTCSMGIMYLDAPFVFAALQKWPRLRRPCCVVGLFIMCGALAASSFSQSVRHLIITQGVLYAVGGSLAYSPTILFVNEWFIKRKGLAFGIMWAGTGLAGVILPLVLQWLLTSYGFRTTLRVWSLALFILTFPLLYFVKPRLPNIATEREHRTRRLFDVSFLWNWHFIVLQGCNILEAVGYFLPTIYLPSFAQQTLHSSALASAFTVIAVNIAAVFGTVVMGTLIDRYHVTTCILISTIGTTIGIFLLWGLATSLPILYLFCVVYGLFAGSFSSTWTGVIKYMQTQTDNADAGLVFAFLAFGRGLGNIVSGPLSEALVRGEPWVGKAGSAYGSGYGPLIVCSGVSALLGGLSFFVRRVGWM
ncbi:MFS general substrate transporter [Tothia fuscella]|uniref:MFS general substrate transporter n=1 Tax=Tothia fuscella TaxID=1048955 RepID=A0A9P4U2D0_9PEZI|nr:MFS general substrate transporter [Tothia fuscella]